jgi:two-component system, sensor histidine kinase and response regulator
LQFSFEHTQRKLSSDIYFLSL